MDASLLQGIFNAVQTRKVAVLYPALCVANTTGPQVWFTLKDTGATQVFDARPPFALLKTIDTGPITNHVNIVHNARGTFAYVTVGGLNQIKVFRTDDYSQVATIDVGNLPHGIWPSGDGSRV
jgi:DNA-binding beta-propeller fold protein YncE